MRKVFRFVTIAGFFAATSQLYSQGFVYDQQSANLPLTADYDNFALYIQPLYQSFVPTLSSIEFVQLEMWDYMDVNTSGGKFSVGIYSGTPSDLTLLATTELLSLPSNFNNDGIVYSGIASFYFATPVELTVGETYYLEPVEIVGDHEWSVAVTGDTYPSGSLYGFSGTDLWFREGVLSTPEPSDFALIAVGGLLLGFLASRTNKNQNT